MAETPTEARRRLRIPRWLLTAASVILLVLIIWFVLVPQFYGAEGALDSLRHLPLSLVVIAVTAEFASMAANSMLTMAVLGRDRPSFFTLLRIDLVSLGLSHVVPAGGGATGAAARFRLLVLAGTRPASALVAATIQTTGSNVVLGVIFTIGVALSLSHFPGNASYLTAAVAALALLLLTGFGIWLLTRHTELAVRLARVVGRRLPFVAEDAAESFVRSMAGRIRTLATEPRRMAVVVLLAAAAWLLDAAALGMLLVAFGHPMAIGPLLTVYGVGGILALLPLTPGGLGIVEGVMIPALVAFGSPHAAALLGVVGWRLLQFWLPIPLAAVAYLSLQTGILRSRRNSGALQAN